MNECMHNTCMNSRMDAQVDIGQQCTEPTGSSLTMKAAGDLHGCSRVWSGMHCHLVSPLAPFRCLYGWLQLARLAESGGSEG